jgi:hypothetical protein
MLSCQENLRLRWNPTVGLTKFSTGLIFGTKYVSSAVKKVSLNNNTKGYVGEVKGVRDHIALKRILDSQKFSANRVELKRALGKTYTELVVCHRTSAMTLIGQGHTSTCAME